LYSVSTVEAADASRLSDDIEIVPTDEQPDAKTNNSMSNNSMSTDSTTADSMPRIKIKSVRSLQAEEFDKMVAAEEDTRDDEIEVIATRTVTSNGNIVTSRQVRLVQIGIPTVTKCAKKLSFSGSTKFTRTYLQFISLFSVR
jgi:hypothetical protein